MGSSPVARVVKRLLALALLLAACVPPAESRPKCPPPPPVPEPEYQAVVVGTIGKLHLVESRYPLAKLAETMAVFKPDLVLVAVRVDPYREDKLEDASYEMTYAAWLAKARGAAVEPIDWFRFEDLVAAPPPVEPADEASIEARETELLRAPRLFTFEQANSRELQEKIQLAEDAFTRHRSGDPLASRRRAWVQHLALDAAARHNRPKRVLAFVDLLDRPLLDSTLGGLGYTTRTPVEVLAKSKEALAAGDIPGAVLASWTAESERAKQNAAKGDAAFWTERAKILDIALEKKGGCCVTQSALR
jgi:hypothetical protein